MQDWDTRIQKYFSNLIGSNFRFNYRFNKKKKVDKNDMIRFVRFVQRFRQFSRDFLSNSPSSRRIQLSTFDT